MTTKTRVKPPTRPRTRYEDDAYTWVHEQIALLRSGNLSEIDTSNIVEELSDVGNELRFRLESAIAVLTQHLLKWDFQPERRSRSWEQSIAEQRRQIQRLLRRNPGLKSVLLEGIEEGFADGRGRALVETKLPKNALPLSCPYAFEDMMNRPIEFEPQPAPKRKKS